MVFLVIAFLLFSVQACADPGVLFFDPGMIHEAYGVNRFPKPEKNEDEEWSFNMHVSPFYQHASGARGPCGGKVSLGDRLGYWKMFPILWGVENGTPKEFNDDNYPNLKPLVDYAADLGDGTAITEDSYEGPQDTDGDWSVAIDYEKLGSRFELDISMPSGFGLTIKGGVVDYRMCPTFTDKTRGESKKGAVGEFLDVLMSPTVRDGMLEHDLCLCLDQYETTAFEDTFAQLYWSNRFACKNNKDELIVNIAPYVGAGVWIPTGKKQDLNKAFSIPTGHDGFWGVNFEGAVNFEFPETITICVGGCLTVFETKRQVRRVPTHCLQQGVYPFKTYVKRRFGTGWNVNASMYAHNIFEHLNVYFEYLYSKHERDTITLCDCCDCTGICDDGCSGCIGGCGNGCCGSGCGIICNPTCETFFPSKLEEDSLWKSQMMHLGFEYIASPCVKFGVAGQTHVSGARVFKTHTIMATASFVF